MTFKQLRDENPNNEQICIVDNGKDGSWPSVMMFSDANGNEWVSFEGEIYAADDDDYWIPCPRVEEGE